MGEVAPEVNSGPVHHYGNLELKSNVFLTCVASLCRRYTDVGNYYGTKDLKPRHQSVICIK